MGFAIRSGNVNTGSTPGWQPRIIEGGQIAGGNSPVRIGNGYTPKPSINPLTGNPAINTTPSPISTANTQVRISAPTTAPTTGVNPLTGNPVVNQVKPQVSTLPSASTAIGALAAIPVVADLGRQVRDVIFGNPDYPPGTFGSLGLVDLARGFSEVVQGRDPFPLPQPVQVGIGDLAGGPFDVFPNVNPINYPPDTLGIWTFKGTYTNGSTTTRTQLAFWNPPAAFEIGMMEVFPGQPVVFIVYRDALGSTRREAFGFVAEFSNWEIVSFAPQDGSDPIPPPGDNPVSNPLPASLPVPGADPIQPNPTNPTQPTNQPTDQPAPPLASSSQEILPGQPVSPISPGAGPLRGAVDRIPGQSPTVLPSPQTIPGVQPHPGKIPNESIIPSVGTTQGFAPLARPVPIAQTPYLSNPIAQDLQQIRQKQEECCLETNTGIGDLAELLSLIQELLNSLQPQTENITISRIVCVDGEANDDPLQITVPAGFGDAIANQFNQLAAIRAQLCESLEIIDVPVVTCINAQPQTNNISIAVAVGTGDQVTAQFNQLAALRAWQCSTGLAPAPDPGGENPEQPPNGLERILELLGDEEFPATVPTTLISKEGEADTTEQINNLPQFIAWFVKQFDAVLGQWEIPLEIQDTDLTQAGDQTAKIKLPNLAEATAEQVGLLMNLTASVNALTNIGMRALTEAGSAHKEAAIAHMYGRENAQFLAYEGKEVDVKLPMAFKPGAESLEDTLKNTEVSIRGWENVDKQDLKFYLHEFLSVASIIRAVYWHRLDPKGNLKDQIKKFIRDADLLDKTQTQTDSDFDQFLNDVEQGFATQPGISDPTNPYGRDITRRPRIRKLGGSPENGSNNQ